MCSCGFWFPPRSNSTPVSNDWWAVSCVLLLGWDENLQLPDSVQIRSDTSALNRVTAYGLGNNVMDYSTHSGVVTGQKFCIILTTSCRLTHECVCVCMHVLSKLCTNKLNPCHCWVLLKDRGVQSCLIRELDGTVGWTGPLAADQTCLESKLAISSCERECWNSSADGQPEHDKTK